MKGNPFDLTGRGALALSCEERVIVTKTWDLACGLAGQTFGVGVTITNLTGSPVSGTQVGFQKSLAGVSRAASRRANSDACSKPSAVSEAAVSISSGKSSR